MFEKLVERIFESASLEFNEAAGQLAGFIDSAEDFAGILEQIGAIPEAIPHDSTEEKLFAKASDMVLSRAFREIGLKSAVIQERGDSADVQAESRLFNYTLVADAKAFRMSRTAKNQKDFKVTALSGWRKDADYAVLCAPYFQYPKTQSQIFAQAIDKNVCLLSWEHLMFLINNGIKESIGLNLSSLWNYGEELSLRVVAAETKKRFLDEYDSFFTSAVGHKPEEYKKLISGQIAVVAQRALTEKAFLEKEKADILRYSKEQAIAELIRSKKIEEKIQQIERYAEGLRHD